MAQKSQTPTEAEDDAFALETLEVEKHDDGSYEHTRTAHERESVVEEQDTAARFWTKLASQQDGEVDVADDDEKVLVAVGLYGWWVNENDWSDRYDRDYAIGYANQGGYGRIENGYGKGLEWTLAVILRDEETESGFAELDGSPVYKFHRMMDRNGDWGAPNDNLTAPKAGTLIMYGVGNPSELDEERILHTDGYPEEEDGSGRDYQGEWSYERAAAAARERIEQRKERDRYSPRTDEILDSVEDDYGPEIRFAADFARDSGQRALARFVDDVDGEDMDPRIADGVTATAATVVETMMELADDPEALRENIATDSGDEDNEEATE